MNYYNPRETNAAEYVNYYRNQASGCLPGYAGGGVMYGAGLGGLFRGLFRMAIPFLKRGFSIAKPHLKSAAKNIVTDVVSNALSRSNNDDSKPQGGSGLMVMARKSLSKPPGIRRRGRTVTKKKKTARSFKKLAVGSRKRKKSVKRNVSVKRTIF